MSDHDHDHDKTFQPDHPEPTTDAARVGLALRELLIEAGHYTADEEREVIAAMQGASPENGAAIVARAWVDPEYRSRLLDNGIEAIKELGFDRIWTEPVTFPLWVRGEDTARVIAPFPQPLHVTALGASVSTPDGGIRAEVAHFENLDALSAAPDGSLDGRIAFISNRMERHRNGLSA